MINRSSLRSRIRRTVKAPNTPRRIWTPRPIDDDHRFKTSWFQPTPEIILQHQALLAHNYFLVRQGDEFGERLRCVRCNNRHDYITLMCIEKPISGLTNGLYAYYNALKSAVPTHELTPAQLSRLEQIYQVLQATPDLSKVHPQMARKVTQDLGPSDLQLGAVSLGILEGISPTRAQRFVDRINDAGLRPPYRLGVLNPAELQRALEYSGFSDQSYRSRW